jgi:NAD(P)-dependent dehydrogenase (short-subunit alcohol dehydrogenase family)
MCASSPGRLTEPSEAVGHGRAPLLRGKVAVVTGAARGMGAATGRLFAREGASVCLWDVRPEVAETAESIVGEGNDAAAFEVDTTDASFVASVAKTILGEYGRIDVLVNCAGIALDMPFLEMDDASRDRVLQVNFLGTFNCCKAVLPAMIAQKCGRVVNISSVTGPVTGVAGLTAYAASKGAVSALTKTLAVEMGPHGSTVNAVLPGAVATPMLGDYFVEMGMDPDEVFGEMAKSIPVGRVGQPEDIAGVCLMLVSDYTRYVSGVELIVDGAMCLPEWNG